VKIPDYRKLNRKKRAELSQYLQDTDTVDLLHDEISRFHEEVRELFIDVILNPQRSKCVFDYDELWLKFLYGGYRPEVASV